MSFSLNESPGLHRPRCSSPCTHLPLGAVLAGKGCDNIVRRRSTTCLARGSDGMAVPWAPCAGSRHRKKEEETERARGRIKEPEREIKRLRRERARAAASGWEKPCATITNPPTPPRHLLATPSHGHPCSSYKMSASCWLTMLVTLRWT